MKKLLCISLTNKATVKKLKKEAVSLVKWPVFIYQTKGSLSELNLISKTAPLLLFKRIRRGLSEKKSNKLNRFIVFVFDPLKLTSNQRKKYQRLRFLTLSIKLTKNVLLLPYIKERVYNKYTYIYSPHILFRFLKQYTNDVKVFPYVVPVSEFTNSFIIETVKREYLNSLHKVLEKIRLLRTNLDLHPYRKIIKKISSLDLKLKILKEKGILLQKIYNISLKKDYLTIYSSYMRIKKRILVYATIL